VAALPTGAVSITQVIVGFPEARRLDRLLLSCDANLHWYSRPPLSREIVEILRQD
jgi:hypothetical protein